MSPCYDQTQPASVGSTSVLDRDGDGHGILAKWGLGITARRRETSTGLMVSLLIAALYFSSILFLDKSITASRETLIILFWLPNILCLGLGCWLFHRASSR